MHDSKRNVLFLCTGNSARSIFAEYLMNKMCGDRFKAYSAGSQPTGSVNPFTIEVLKEQHDLDASEARSKSWNEVKEIPFDVVITVCDNAKGSCPIFPGKTRIVHWSIPDPPTLQEPMQRSAAPLKIPLS